MAKGCLIFVFAESDANVGIVPPLVESFKVLASNPSILLFAQLSPQPRAANEIGIASNRYCAGLVAVLTTNTGSLEYCKPIREVPIPTLQRQPAFLHLRPEMDPDGYECLYLVLRSRHSSWLGSSPGHPVPPYDARVDHADLAFHLEW